MKTTLLLASLFFIYLNANSQNNGNNGQGVTQWKTNGNIADSNHFIGTKNNFPVKFRTSDFERLRITAEGNIGIGTFNPIAKLDVNGTTILRESLKLSGLDFSNGLADIFLFIDENGFVKKGSMEKALEMIYQTKECGEGPINNPTWSNGINKIFVNCPQVNVGINTMNPRVNLDVLGTTYTNRLAIGTADPLATQANFHMKVNAAASNSSTIFLIESLQQPLLSMNYQGWLNTKNITNEGHIYSQKIIINTPTDEGSPFYVTKGPNGSDRLLQLDYNGMLHARRIKVDADSWADFVFEEDYELMPLKDVKLFIEKNSHLPDVPSEASVIEDGVDLLEMNKILLKKVEELTLYLISQDLMLENQQLELEAMKKKLSGLESEK